MNHPAHVLRFAQLYLLTILTALTVLTRALSCVYHLCDNFPGNLPQFLPRKLTVFLPTWSSVPVGLRKEVMIKPNFYRCNNVISQSPLLIKVMIFPTSWCAINGCACLPVRLAEAKPHPSRRTSSRCPDARRRRPAAAPTFSTSPSSCVTTLLHVASIPLWKLLLMGPASLAQHHLKFLRPCLMCHGEVRVLESFKSAAKLPSFAQVGMVRIGDSDIHLTVGQALVLVGMVGIGWM
eukprot:g49499.t1